MFQLPVRGAGPGDGLRGVRSEDQPRHDPVVFSEAGVGCKSLNLKILPALFSDVSVLSACEFVHLKGNARESL